MQRDAANTCPYTGERCSEYGSGYCSYECPDNPDYEDDEDESDYDEDQDDTENGDNAEDSDEE